MSRFFGRIALWATLCAALLFGAVAAQETGGPDYATWEDISARAELALETGRASDTALMDLRGQIDAFRQQFLDARDANANRIRTLQSQLDALGPRPEEGSEAPDVAERRAALEEQLQRLRAPALVAEAAFNQANGLVAEIDLILRERQASKLMARGPTPLNPGVWPEALRDLRMSVETIFTEFSRGWQNPVQRAEFRQDLPAFLLFMAIALLLIWRGRNWAGRFGEFLRARTGRATGVARFFVSLGRIVLPYIGLVLMVEALFLTGFVGLRSTAIVQMIPAWGAVLLFLGWLSDLLFSRNDEDAVVGLPADRRAEMRFYGTALAALFVLAGAVEELMAIESASAEAQHVIGFPILLAIAVLLARMGQILSRVKESDAETAQHAVSGGLARFLRLTGRVVIAVSFAGPIAAVLGYAELARFLLLPTILTLALFGGVLALQRLVADIYGVVTGQGAAARESLIPVLIGFLLVLVAIPALALIWGARVTDLTEVWTRSQGGFAIGDTRISPANFFWFALLFASGYALTRIVQSTFRTNLLPKTRLDIGAQTAAVSGLGYIGIFLTALIAISGAGIDLTSLAVVAGALSVGIGFGLQNIVSNFVSGIILLIERPISEGDWIEVDGQMGFVRDISVRSTRIETFDRTDVIVPNSNLVSGTVTNYTRGNTVGRVIVAVGVAYGTDTRRVETILTEIAESHPMVLQTPPPAVIFQGFGADSLDFEIRAILRDVNWVLSVKSEMNHEIARRFAEEGIEIPFAQRDIWLRNPEVLRGGAQAGGDAEPPDSGKTTP